MLWVLKRGERAAPRGARTGLQLEAMCATQPAMLGNSQRHKWPDPRVSGRKGCPLVSEADGRAEMLSEMASQGTALRLTLQDSSECRDKKGFYF